MKVIGITKGSKEQAVELIIGVDTVYVHSDIHRVDTEDNSELYEYVETQYDKDEYIKLMSEKNSKLEKELTSTQLALCDVYEMLV